MPDVETQQVELKIGRYIVKPGAPILDAAMWYVQEPSPLGADAHPFVAAMASSRRRACRVAAALAVLDLAGELLTFARVYARTLFVLRQADADEVIEHVEEALRFSRKD